jgi:minimal CRISPR polymerase domain
MASQEVFLMIDADKISPNVERAVRRNDPSKIARMGQNIERGDRILRSWLEDKGGKVLLFHGDEIYASVPGDHLSELGKIHGELQEAWNDSITIGVGLDLNEAKKALEGGKKRGGSRIVFYSPEIDKILSDEESASDSHEAKTPSPDPEKLKELSKAELQKSNTPSPGMGIHAIKHRSLQMDRGAPSPDEPSPFNAPQASPHGETPVTPSATNMAAGLPSAVSGPSVLESQFHSAAAGTEAEAARAEAQANAAQPADPTIDTIKQNIAKILQKVKQQAPVLEQLKDQAPDAYQAIVASIQAMLMMAKSLMPQSGAQPQPQEGAEKEKEVAKKEAEFIMEDLIKNAREIRALRSIVLNDQATPEQLAHAAKLIVENPKDMNEDIINEYANHPKADPKILEELVSNPKLNRNLASYIIRHRITDPTRLWERIKNRFHPEKKEPEPTPEGQTPAPAQPDTRTRAQRNEEKNQAEWDKKRMLDALNERPLPPEVQKDMWKTLKDNGSRRNLINRGSDVAPELIHEASKIPGYQDYILNSPHLPPQAHAKALKSAINEVKKYKKMRHEGKFLSWTDSDKEGEAQDRIKKLTTSSVLPIPQADEISREHLGKPTWRDVDAEHLRRGHAQISVKPGLHRMRQVRDHIEGRGGELSPADLGRPVAQMLGNVGRMPNGNFNSKKIQEHIDSIPGIPLHVDTSEWTGAQRHSKDNSKVLRVSLPTEMTEKLRAQGIQTKSGHTESHPGDPISGLGWIRWTGDHKGVHIDEIQHDYSLGHQKAIEKMLGHPINRVLTDAFHEWARTGGGKAPSLENSTTQPVNPPIKPPKPNKNMPTVGTPVHIWTPESKAPLSSLEEDQALPAHFQSTYRQNPEKMGMQPGTYGTLPTQSNKSLKGKPTYQDVFRKSVAQIREAALAKAYSVSDHLNPMSTGIDHQIKVQDSAYPIDNDKTSVTVKSDQMEGAPTKGSRLSKIRKNALTKQALVKDLPMPEASNKTPHSPSGAMVGRVEGDATPQAHKYRHIEPGEAAHVSMDGKPAGKIAIRQAQSGQTLPNEQVSEAQTGLLHPTSALDPKDGRAKQGNQQG